MTSERPLMGLALAACLLAGACLRAEEKVEGDLKRLQGEWVTKTFPGGDVFFTFKDKKLTVKAPSRTYTITVTLDEKAKPEKTIDLKIDEAPEDAKGKTCMAIYKFDGEEKLILCFALEGRPEKYEQKGFEQWLVELKRKNK